jgi:hypothetical protein
MSNLTEQQLAVIAKMPDALYVSVPEGLYDCDEPWEDDENLAIGIDTSESTIVNYAHTLIQYRKVTSDDGKLVLQGKWVDVMEGKIWSYKVAGQWFANMWPVHYGFVVNVTHGKQLLHFDCDTIEQAAVKARHCSTEFFAALSPNIVVIHDDTLPEFK